MIVTDTATEYIINDYSENLSYGASLPPQEPAETSGRGRMRKVLEYKEWLWKTYAGVPMSEAFFVGGKQISAVWDGNQWLNMPAYEIIFHISTMLEKGYDVRVR